jgi:hypothetical protein
MCAGPRLAGHDVADERLVAVVDDGCKSVDSHRVTAEVIDNKRRIEEIPQGSGLRSRVRHLSAARADPFDDLLRGRELGIVGGGPGSGRPIDHLAESVTFEPRPKGLSHVAAPAARASKVIDLIDEFLREQQICAHVHAHTLAHDRGEVNAEGDVHPLGRDSRRQKPGLPSTT